MIRQLLIMTLNVVDKSIVAFESIFCVLKVPSLQGSTRRHSGGQGFFIGPLEISLYSRLHNLLLASGVMSVWTFLEWFWKDDCMHVLLDISCLVTIAS
jgi:hypothetical protein